MIGICGLVATAISSTVPNQMQIAVAVRKHVVLLQKNCLLPDRLKRTELRQQTDEAAERDEAWNNSLR